MTPTIRSERFGIVSNNTRCHACGQITPVTALLVDGGQWRDSPGDDDWYRIEDAGLLMYVQDLNPTALAAWQSVASWVQHLPSRTAGISYWSNACVHCSALQGDSFLTKPDGSFFPTTSEGETAVSLEWASGPLEAIAVVSESRWFDRLADGHPMR